jgi:hypothetical protein
MSKADVAELCPVTNDNSMSCSISYEYAEGYSIGLQEGGSGERRGDAEEVELASAATFCAAFRRAAAAAFFSRDCAGSFMKMHSFSREVHFVHGCFRSHLTLDSAHAWHDFRRDLFWLRLWSHEFANVPDDDRHPQITATALMPCKEITPGELGKTSLRAILSVTITICLKYRTSQR